MMWPNGGPPATSYSLHNPSYRVLERHDWSRLSLMLHLSLVHMHRRRSGSSQTLDRRRSRIVVACVPGCVPRAGHQLLIRPSYRVLERHEQPRSLLMAHLSLVYMHIRRFNSSQTLDRRFSLIVSRVCVRMWPKAGRSPATHFAIISCIGTS